MRDIGKNIRDLRQSKSMTQDTLAEKLYVTRQTVSNYETGRTRPDVEMVVKIAEILETDANTILYGIPAPPERKADNRKLIIAAAAALLLFPLYFWAGGIAAWYQTSRYLAWPKLLLGIFVTPIPFALLGWTMMQAIGTFTKLEPVRNKFIPPMIFGMVIFYLAVMFPYVISIFVEFSLPAFWGRMVFGLLCALPGMPIQVNRGLVCFLLGILLWLFRMPKAQPELPNS